MYLVLGGWGVVGGRSFYLQGLEFVTIFLLFCPVSLLSVRTSRGSSVDGIISGATRRASNVLDIGGMGPAAISILFSGGRQEAVSFCKRGVFHMFRSGSKKVVHSPRTGPRTRVLMSRPHHRMSGLTVSRGSNVVALTAKGIQIRLGGRAKLVGIVGLKAGTYIVSRATPIMFRPGGMAIALGRRPSRCFCNNNMRGKHFSRGNGIVTVRGRGD